MKIIENLNFYFIFTIIIFSFLAKNTAFCTLTDIDSPNIKENKSISLCKKGHFYSNVFKLSNQNTIPATNNGQADSSSVVQSEEPVIKRIVYYFGHLSGIFGYFFLSLGIFVGAGARWLDRFSGLPEVLPFHKKLTAFAYLILLFHPSMIAYHAILSNFFPKTYFIPIWNDIKDFYGAIAFYILTIIIVTSVLKKFIPRRLWHSIHLFSIAVITFATLHIFKEGTLIFDKPLYKIIFYTGLCAASTGIIIRILMSIMQYKKHYSTVIGVVPETPDTYTLKVNKPAGFNYRAGQFCIIRFYKKGLTTPHPFTISSSPLESEFCFTIKSHREFTSQIRNLQKGDKIRIEGPYGVFTYKNKSSVFIAGGVGITPFKSIINDYVMNEKNTDITLIYGSRDKSNVIFCDYFERLRAENKVKIYQILSNDRSTGFDSGHITFDYLKSKNIDFSSDFYLCGPPVMIKNLRKTINKNKANKSKIFYEKFFY